MEKFLNQPNLSTESADALQTLHDVSLACVFGLEKLDIKVCCEIFTHILIEKLPEQSRIEWEKQLGKSKTIPVFDTLIEFINLRFRTLEAIQLQSYKIESKPSTSNNSGTGRPPTPQPRKEFNYIRLTHNYTFLYLHKNSYYTK